MDIHYRFIHNQQPIATQDKMIGAYSMMFLQFKLRGVMAGRFNPSLMSVGPHLLCDTMLPRHHRDREEPTSAAIAATAAASLHHTSLHHCTAILLHTPEHIKLASINTFNTEACCADTFWQSLYWTRDGSATHICSSNLLASCTVFCSVFGMYW